MREYFRVHTTIQVILLALAGPITSAFTSIHPAIATPSPHEEVVGFAEVVDGDTLVINGTRIRLEGIDAPERAQTCNDNRGGQWRCGAAAKAFLTISTAGTLVRCAPRGNDRYGRVLGLCHAGDLELNASLVRGGLAWAFRRYTVTYVGAEQEARVLERGIWQGETEPAWVFREKRWRAAETQVPAGCAIKGNNSRRGRLYHMPWSPLYDRVRIDERRGERWFCSEDEALRAGWQPAARK